MDNGSHLNRKRSRVDSDESESTNPESKIIRIDSDDPESNNIHPKSKLSRVDSTNSVASSHGSGTTEVGSEGNSGESSTQPSARVNSGDSVEVKLFEDVLNILDYSDTVIEGEPPVQDLHSVIKSFEEEIHNPAAFPVHDETTSGSTESTQQELGYLLEASDDELGLPPTNGATEEGGVIEAVDFTANGSDESAGLDGTMLGFENDIIPSYDSFEFGIGGNYNDYVGRADDVALGGLFDYSDGGGGGGGGVADVSWPTESLSAL